jgi:hypothetical protein
VRCQSADLLVGPHQRHLCPRVHASIRQHTSAYVSIREHA